jgi:hypothetical protein
MALIDQWKNKTFKGSQFNNGVYDESFPLFQLQEMGLPFAMACFEIGPNEVIAVGMDRGNQSPRDFIKENQNNIFTLDESKPSRKIRTMLGEKTVHYAKHVGTEASSDKNERELELDFVFRSSDHLRYENGRHVSGPHGGAPRALKVEPNISGNEGYTVTMFNIDGGQAVVQMAPKQMKLIGTDDEKNSTERIWARCDGSFFCRLRTYDLS